MAIVLLTSCDNNDIRSDNDHLPLRFETNEAVWRTSLRSSDYTGDTGVNPIPDMLIYGYQTGDEDWVYVSNTASPSFMNGFVITNNGGTWEYEPLLYFFPDAKHTFFAYAPYTKIKTDSRNSFSIAEAGGAPVLNYHLSTQVDNQQDLLFGKRINVKETDTDASPVNIVFNHITTKVIFSACIDPSYTVSSGTTVKISSIVFQNIYLAAQTKVQYSEEGTPSVIWENHYTQSDLSLTLNTESINGLQDVDLKTSAGMLVISQNLYLIPQSIPSGAQLTIEVQETNAGTTIAKVQTFDLTVLSASWSPGQSINYQLTYNGYTDNPISMQLV